MLSALKLKNVLFYDQASVYVMLHMITLHIVCKYIPASKTNMLNPECIKK